MLKVLELFAGRRCIGKAFESCGHQVFSIDYDMKHSDIDWYADIGKITAADILSLFGKPDVIWASPNCSVYSIASISHHGTKEPFLDYFPNNAHAESYSSLIRYTRLYTRFYASSQSPIPSYPRLSHGL